MEDSNVVYHHFSLNFDPSEVRERFKDVRVVLIAGCPYRVQAQAEYLAEKLFNDVRFPKEDCQKLTKSHSRFVLYKLGPVLVSDHGMGAPSISIALHELVLMCRQAGVENSLNILRFGTCGGIGKRPGTVCITNKAYDPLFNEYIELKICDQTVKRDCVVNQEVASELIRLAREQPNRAEMGDYQVLEGATLSSNDFYEELGRMNGAICEHTSEDKLKFLQKAKSMGVINTEMESLALTSMCHKLAIPCGVLCVVVTDRLATDLIHLTEADTTQLEQRLFWINSLFIEHKLRRG